MSIDSTLQGLITAAKEWAAKSRTDAATALATLQSMDIPYMQIGAVPFTPLVITSPDTVTPPTPLSVGTAPAIAQISDIVKPNAPTITDVTLGTLLSITLPDVPVIEFPSINIDAPVYSVTAPTNWDFSISNILITDDPMITTVMDRLEKNIKYGGTGLSETVENAIWDRDRERNEQQLSDSTDKLISVWAKKGFSLPDGLLAHSLAELQTEYLNKNLDRSRDIAIEQGKLEQSNLFKSMELAVSLTSKLIDMLIQYETLSLRCQEDIAKFANEYIDMQIKTYLAKVEAYKATAQVHEMMIRASLAKVEVYKTQLEGQRLIMQINEETVKIYVEQLRASTVLIDRYKSEVEAMVAELGIEKVKLEANKLQMDAWAKGADVLIQKFASEVELYKANSQQNVAIADLESRQTEANLRATISATELSIKAIEISNRSLQLSAQLKLEAAKGVAQFASTLAAGAMAGISTGVSESYSEQRPLVEGA